jgi:hypothetical protein
MWGISRYSLIQTEIELLIKLQRSYVLQLARLCQQMALPFQRMSHVQLHEQLILLEYQQP